MKTFRVAIIGCGGIANAHATVLQNLPQTELVAFCDVAKERADGFNTQYAEGKANVYDNAAALFETEKLDVVYICLPPFAHGDEVKLAAQKGVHVFIEKPIALTIEKGEEMVEAIETHGVKSQVGFMFRFGKAVERVKELIDSGEAGAPGWAVGTYQCNSLHGPWWREKDKSGGQIVEQIIHTYDIIRYFIGAPAQVFAFTDNVFHQDVEKYTAEDVSVTGIKFQSGAVASVSGTNGAIPNVWRSAYSLVCKNLTANFIDANNATLYFTGDADNVREETIEADSQSSNMMQSETLDLLNAIESGGSTRTPMREGLETLRLVLAARQSGETGHVVKL